MLSLLFASLLLAPKPAVSASVLTAHVRPLSNIAATILRDAARRSATIEQLLFDLQQLDVIVYVELGWLGRDHGSTTIMPAGGSTRMLRVVIGARLDPVRRFEVLGHELSHALEIARTPWVRDPATFRALYQQIGFAVSATAFETAAARDVERQVRADLSATGAARR